MLQALIVSVIYDSSQVVEKDIDLAEDTPAPRVVTDAHGNFTLDVRGFLSPNQSV